MNRIPPNLVYLAIYNPTLHNSGPLDGDDEDAEEQAHILFYTSKERAVSRDRMLRQIGLAKALVNFAEMFNTEGPLDNVHSQARRMVMVTPEPDFWIHACVELAKVPRIVQDKGRGRNKGKGKEKEKEKEAREGPIYDYEDGSVQDGALREDILRGYERFKLTHGSFTSVLDHLGQEALALQLERFWTPWAWSWTLADGHDFGQHLGVALHPYYKALLPILDDLQTDIPPEEIILLLLSSSSLIPSTTFLNQDYPISLPLYLMSLIPPPREPSVHEDDDTLGSSQITIKHSRRPRDRETNSEPGGGGGFLGMPVMNVNMDVRKWNWTGVFGRNSAKTSPASTSVSSASSRRSSTDRKEEQQDSKGPVKAKGSEDNTDAQSVAEARVDQNALDDAISSRVSPSPPPKGGNSESSVEEGLPSLAADTSSLSEHQEDSPSVDGDQLPLPRLEEEEEERRTIKGPEVMTPKPPPAFLRRTVHLPYGDDVLATCQRKVYFLLKGQWMLALIGGKPGREEAELQVYLDSVAGRSERFFENVEDAIQEEMRKSTSDSLPSAAKILQPLDIHIGSTGKYTFCGKSFQSKSGLLYEARTLQERDPEISEVFSRGQNPQHWHVARRTHRTGGEPAEMYLEVFRKETSLADVDNVLAGAVKSWKAAVGDLEGL